MKSNDNRRLKNTSREASAKDAGIKRFLGEKWWQGVAAILAVVAIIVGVYTTRSQPPEKEVRPENSTPQQQQNITGDQNCIAQGDNNSVTCPAAARSYGKVDFASYQAGYAFFQGSPDQLPVPPDYPESEFSGHCDEWQDWMASTASIYSGGNGFGLQIMAGSDDLVVVKNIEVKVFSKKIAQAGTTINCVHGGGSNAGYSVNVDTQANRTTFTSWDGDGSKVEMPPGSISLGQKDSGFTDAAISITSEDGYLYEGEILISAIVNGETKTISWGSSVQPLRWVSDAAGGLIQGPEEAFDWDVVARRWQKGMVFRGVGP